MPDEAPVTSATSFLSFIGLPSRTWSVIIVRSSYDEHHILMQKKAPDTTGADRLRCPLGPSASETLRAGPWRAWGHRPRGPAPERRPSWPRSRARVRRHPDLRGRANAGRRYRSEEHTSELQSLAYLVCRLLLEKKNQKSSQPLHQPSTPVRA